MKINPNQPYDLHIPLSWLLMPKNKGRKIDVIEFSWILGIPPPLIAVTENQKGLMRLPVLTTLVIDYLGQDSADN